MYVTQARRAERAEAERRRDNGGGGADDGESESRRGRSRCRGSTGNGGRGGGVGGRGTDDPVDILQFTRCTHFSATGSPMSGFTSGDPSDTDFGLGRGTGHGRSSTAVDLRVIIINVACQPCLWCGDRHVTAFARGELYPVQRRKVHPRGWVLSHGGNMGQVRRRLSVTLML